MFCPQCGNAVNDDSKFCPKCGKQLASAAVPAAQPASKGAPASTSAQDGSGAATASSSNAAPAPADPPSANATKQAPSTDSPATKSKKPLIIGGIAAVAVVAAIAVAVALLMRPTTYTGTVDITLPYETGSIELTFNDDGAATLALTDTSSSMATEVSFKGTYERVDDYKLDDPTMTIRSGVYSFDPESVEAMGITLDIDDFMNSMMTSADTSSIEDVFLDGNIKLVIPDKAQQGDIRGTWGIRLQGLSRLSGVSTPSGTAPEEFYADITDDSFRIRSESDAPDG